MAENPKESAGRSKLQLQLCPPAAKREMARALENGAKEYGAWNWRKGGIKLMTYVGAMQRHLDAIADGEDIDRESGFSHLGHILAGAAVVVDAFHASMVHDDRPGSDPHGAHNVGVSEMLNRSRDRELRGSNKAQNVRFPQSDDEILEHGE